MTTTIDFRDDSGGCVQRSFARLLFLSFLLIPLTSYGQNPLTIKDRNGKPAEFPPCGDGAVFAIRHHVTAKPGAVEVKYHS